jgi:hypothetical protein
MGGGMIMKIVGTILGISMFVIGWLGGIMLVIFTHGDGMGSIEPSVLLFAMTCAGFAVVGAFLTFISNRRSIVKYINSKRRKPNKKIILFYIIAGIVAFAFIVICGYIFWT